LCGEEKREEIERKIVTEVKNETSWKAADMKRTTSLSIVQVSLKGAVAAGQHER
jgi:hypothetical protein